jgi:NlpC/P60 family putative phage cell wall peptidase
MSPSPEAIVTAARAWLGTPYRHQAATLGAGCDCVGLLRGVWRTLYGKEPPPLPPYRADWRDLRHADELAPLAEAWLRPTAGPLAAGQIVLFRLGRLPRAKHCGILIGAGRFIHAQERLGVAEASLSDNWRRRIAARFSFPEFEDV